MDLVNDFIGDQSGIFRGEFAFDEKLFIRFVMGFDEGYKVTACFDVF